MEEAGGGGVCVSPLAGEWRLASYWAMQCKFMVFGLPLNASKGVVPLFLRLVFKHRRNCEVLAGCGIQSTCVWKRMDSLKEFDIRSVVCVRRRTCWLQVRNIVEDKESWCR